MTINSVTSSNGLYEAMVQQAAALRAAQETRVPAGRVAQPQTGRPSAAQSAVGKSGETGTFAHSLSDEEQSTAQRSVALPASSRSEAKQLPRKVAGAYRSPWADANSLVVQTRSPGALTAPVGDETTVAAAAPRKAEAPKPTFVEVHSVYVDGADEESARDDRNPLSQFASQLYQNVVATSRRSTAGQYIGSSFSAVA